MDVQQYTIYVDEWHDLNLIPFSILMSLSLSTFLVHCSLDHMESDRLTRESKFVYVQTHEVCKTATEDIILSSENRLANTYTVLVGHWQNINRVLSLVLFTDLLGSKNEQLI
jgi:hypothetical protein